MATGGNSQTFNLTFDANMNVGGVLNAVKQMQGAFSGLKLPTNMTANILKDFDKLRESLNKFKSISEKETIGKTDIKALNKLQSEIESTFSHLENSFADISSQKIYLDADYTKIKDAQAEIDRLKNDLKTKLGELKFDLKSPKGGTVSLGINQMVSDMERGVKSSKVLSAAMKEVGQSIQSGNFSAVGTQLAAIENKATSLKGASAGLLEVFRQWGIIDFSGPAKNLVEAKKHTDLLHEGFKKLLPLFAQDQEAVKRLVKEINDAVNEKARLEKEGQSNIADSMNSGADAARTLANAEREAAKESIGIAEATSRAATEVKQLQQSTQYFFSLRNMINLLKRGLREAVDVVKELDAAMTETAVVTDYSVGDMWQKLPEYTANANALGATVKDMYEATTLYYQQGLRTDAAMGIANETMKMARIGGLEAADATDKMTAALRGFNMEINETSAQRVNDVYSNLAAKTASNTEELGTAMQRTASIAHSAGMSFEGTAAFLAQAIETTREPAENLGTAMKTIVARFTELKKNPLEITEVDGEEVSYNKVDTALQSIGVSLKDANGQFRDLDKVFLDISKRWDSLTQTQQRYVATTAAGSRQQSRFIAMMSNYERTLQLMDYANNSTGASNEQFGKTMESLEAKLNKLKNAWDQFLMGIMNDSWVKGLVDAGTGILKIVNDIINALSFGGKLKGMKSLLSIGTAGIALKAGGNIINKLIGGLGGFVDPTSSFRKGFWGAGKTTAEGVPTTGLAGKITTPIVQKLSELIALTKTANGIKDNFNPKTTSTANQYKAISSGLRNTTSNTIGTISSRFNQLSDEHAYMAYKTSPGTISAMRQSALGWLNNQNLSTEMQKTGQQLMANIFKGMSKGEIPVKKGMQLIGKPALWGQHFGTDVAKSFSDNYIKNLKAQIPKIETNTQQAHEKALSAMGYDKNNESFAKLFTGTSAEFKTLMSNDNMRNAYIKYFKQFKTELEGSLEQTPVVQQKSQQLGNNIAAIGSNFTAAGYSVQMFGSQLAQLSPALQGVGALISKVGGLITTFGYGFAGAGKIVTTVGGQITKGIEAARLVKYGDTIGSLINSGQVASGGMIAAAGAKAASANGAQVGAGFMSGFLSNIPKPLLAAGIAAAVVGAIALVKHIVEKRAKEAGEEVRKDFEKGFTETSKKIDSIDGYKDRFEELSQGVDRFGHNVSLSAEEYDEYLNIASELKDLSPSLIAGYNAEGQAILKKGAALDEVIDKLKEERDLALDSYITDSSINKLIGEYKTSDAYKDNKKKVYGYDNISQGFGKELNALSRANAKAKLDFDVADAIEQLGGGTVDSLTNLTAAQSSFVAQHYSDILNLVKEKNSELDEEVEEGLKDAFADLGGAIEDVTTEGQPIIDAMQRWMGDKKLDATGLALGDEFAGGFTQGFNAIMTQGLAEGWSSEQFKNTLRDYSSDWRTLGGESSKYNEILTKATEAQENYLDAIGTEGAVEDYQNSVEGLAIQLEGLAKQYEGTGTAGQFFAEQCLQQANALRNYATEGAMSIGEALNVLSNNFAEARGAKERFDKAIEGGDYYTAAEGYRSIAETVLDAKNAAGDGSIAGWAGAEELLGRDFVDNNSWKDIKKRVQEVNSLFDDGIEGVYNFNDMLVNAWNNGKIQDMGKVVDGAFDFDFDNVENIKEWAKELEISEGVLSAMIDKSRQFAAFNVGNNKEIRHALEQSNQAMIGQSRKGGKSALYTSESAFREQARQQGIHGDDYAKTKRDLTKEQNVKFLTVDSLTSKDKNGFFKLDKVLADVGLTGRNKTLDGAVAALTQMGFSLEEQQRILTADGIKLADGEASDKEVSQAYQEHAFAEENPTVAGIAGDTGVIATAATAMLAQMGIMTDQMRQDIRDATSNPTIEGYENSLKPEGGFKDTASRDAARASVEAQIDNYQATMDILKQGHLEDTAEYQALQRASEELTQALNEEEASWTAANQKIVENLPVLEKITDENDKQYLESHATDVQTALHAANVDTGIAALQQLQEQGNLSVETMDQLANAFIALHATDLSVMDDAAFAKAMNDLGIYGSEVEALRQSFQKPFTIQTKLTGEDLKEYVANIDGLTEKERSIILKSYVNNADKVTDLLNEINNEFGDGTEETKSIIVQATAKLATGDAKGAHDLLQEQFGDDAETIETQLNIICDGSIANPNEVKSALEGEIEGLKPDAQVKVSADVSKINGSVSVDTKSIEAARADAATGAEMPIYAEASSFETKVKALQQTGKKTINISPNFTGTWRHDLIITKTERKRGQNYSIPAHQSLSFGAAANGLNLPKKKRSSGQQMTALVGEEGFEVGYIPSESRSMILGANGPEITSFPKETVIYPHKQSKEIIRKGKKDHKTIGSFVSGLLPSRPDGGGGGGGGGGNTGGRHRKGGKGSTSSTSKKKNYNNWSIEEVIRFDIDQNLERLASELKRITDDIEDNLGKIGNTASQISGAVNDQLQNLKASLDYNKELADSYQRQLDELLNAKSANYKISYTQANGKSADKLINPAQYIFQNEDGTYEVDVDAIQSLTAGKNANENTNRALRESVFNEVSKILNELQSGIIKTADEIASLEKQIKENAEKISEAFYQWENELTEVYDLSQRIADETSLTNRFASQVSLELSRLNVGFGTAEESINNIRNALTRNNLTIQEQIKNQQQMIAARQRELNAALSFEDELERLSRFENMEVSDELPQEVKDANVAWAQQQAEAAKLGNSYVKNLFRDLDGSIQYDIDWEKFNEDQKNDPYNKETYDAIKQYLDDLNEKATAFNDSIKDQTDFIKQTYDALKEYQDYVVDVEDTLIKGTEEQIQKAQDNAKKISDSITNALKDLLDEVKRKLDERRKAEDNAKTEQDISQKQQRLAALRADTAGGHQVEIAQLEKEIADAQQSYQRTLEDQLLDRLSQQADEASKQRERQIELAEISNTLSSENNKAEVDMWLRNPTQFKEEIKAAYLEANGYDEKGEAGQAALLNSFESWFANLVTAVEQSGFNSENGVFKPTDDGAETAVNLANKMETLIGREDELALAVNALKDATNRNTESLLLGIDKEKYSAKYLKDLGIDASTLTELKYSLDELVEAGFNASELTKAGYGADQLKDKFTAKQLRDAGYKAGDLIKAGITDAKTLKGAGYSAKDLTEAGINDAKTLSQAGYNAADLKAAGFNAKALKDANFGISKLKDEGKFSLAELKTAFSAEEFGSGGIKFDEAITVFSEDELADVTEYAEDIEKLRHPYGYIADYPSIVYNKNKVVKGVKALQNALNRLNNAGLTVDGKFGNSTKTALKAFQKKEGISQTGKVDNKTRAKFKALGYKTGGLADYTGPAWLDGTPSRPELVLNAKDTQNFLALRDVLSKAVSSAGSTTNSYGGDAMYEININVDHIASDYDVDKVAERVKKIIVKDSGYRNVTQVRNFR